MHLIRALMEDLLPGGGDPPNAAALASRLCVDEWFCSTILGSEAKDCNGPSIF